MNIFIGHTKTDSQLQAFNKNDLVMLIKVKKGLQLPY